MSAVTQITYTGTVVVCTTRSCPVCGKIGTVEIPIAEWEAWADGTGPMIQHAMPSVSAGDREMLLSGTHDACWEATFAPDDEEVEPYGIDDDTSYTQMFPHDEHVGLDEPEGYGS